MDFITLINHIFPKQGADIANTQAAEAGKQERLFTSSLVQGVSINIFTSSMVRYSRFFFSPCMAFLSTASAGLNDNTSSSTANPKAAIMQASRLDMVFWQKDGWFCGILFPSCAVQSLQENFCPHHTTLPWEHSVQVA